MGKKENPVQKVIMEYLRYLPECFAWRNNTGATKIDNRFIRYGYPGSPDILVCYRGLMICIECKSAKGKQNANQKSFQGEVEKSGGVYILAYCLGDVLCVLEGLF